MLRRKLFQIICGSLLATAALIWPAAQRAYALPEPSFRAVCYVTKQAADDPIVYPGQPGKSHMHMFFGSHTVNSAATTATLLADQSAQCGSHYTMDHSAYWVPQLYQNGQAIYRTDGSISTAVYYKKAGGPGGTPVAQGYPQGLRIIAGDMHATTPQDNIWFKCINTEDTGSQNSYEHEIPSCQADESLAAVVEFPDCWNGTALDSANHKSHMAHSAGQAGTCPAAYPVKLPKVSLEVVYWRVNGPARAFAFASGGQYSFHADIFSAWDARAEAGLVNYCLNFANGPVDCNPLMFEKINLSSVTAAQMNAISKWAGVAVATPTPAAVPVDHSHMGGMVMPSASPAPGVQTAAVAAGPGLPVAILLAALSVGTGAALISYGAYLYRHDRPR